MSHAVADAFARARVENRAALVAYIMAGDPSLADTLNIARAAIEGGADIVELGLAYSDPLADGPTIQAAGARALAGGATFDATLMSGVGRSGVPAIAFGYWNPMFVRGPERTARDLARAGFAGAIVADLPPEEGERMRAACLRENLVLPLLVAPTTPPARVAVLARASSGFVYAVSRLGVTGARADLDAGTEALVTRIKRETELPVAVGFGISTASQAASVARYADGVVVGSALVDAVARSHSAAEACVAVRAACSVFAAACRR